MKSTGQHLPTSLLNGLILCSQFWLRPLLPTLSAPCVAADAEFVGLLFLGSVLKFSGVFFLKRNDVKDGLTQVFKNHWHRLCKAVVL